MQPVLRKIGCNLLKQRHSTQVNWSFLAQEVQCATLRRPLISVCGGLGHTVSRVSLTGCRSLGQTVSPVCLTGCRSLSNEPPKHWDDMKDLPRFHPDKGELVYVGNLAFMVKAVKAFSVSTSLLGLGLQPYLLYHTQHHAVATVLAVGAFMGFFIFCTPLLIHFITKKYVTDMYYNSDTGIFTATTYNLFVRRKSLQFLPDDVKVPDIPGMFTTITAKGRPLFIDRDMFSTKKAYIKMMGYDKPLDWEIHSQDEKSKEKDKL